jgi:hypothetical protein
MAEKHFLDNIYKYDKPYKLIKDLIEYNHYLFSIYDNKYIYTFYTKQSESYGTKKYYRSRNHLIIYDPRYKFYIQFFFENKDWDPIRNKYEMKFFSFIIVKVFNRWTHFVKKRKRQRIFLKLLKHVSLHLGNPRFVDFNV